MFFPIRLKSIPPIASFAPCDQVIGGISEQIGHQSVKERITDTNFKIFVAIGRRGVYIGPKDTKTAIGVGNPGGRVCQGNSNLKAYKAFGMP